VVRSTVDLGPSKVLLWLAALFVSEVVVLIASAIGAGAVAVVVISMKNSVATCYLRCLDIWVKSKQEHSQKFRSGKEPMLTFAYAPELDYGWSINPWNIVAVDIDIGTVAVGITIHVGIAAAAVEDVAADVKIVLLPQLLNW
jgi:hypothetical protein